MTNLKDGEKCPDCGVNPAIVVPSLVDSSKLMYLICEECQVKRDEEEREKIAAEGLRRRKKVLVSEIPPLYLDYGEETFPPTWFPPEWEEMKDWEPGDDGRGLLLTGDTGTCKTTMMAALLRVLLLEKKISIGFVRASNLARLVREQFSKNSGVSEEARERLERLRSVGVLGLDDLGKQANSPAVEEAIYDLIEDRTSYLKPMIVTINAMGDELAGMMTEDRGRPIVRRLREFCKPIVIES